MASTVAEQDESKIASVTSNASHDIKAAAAASRINSQNGASPSPSLNSKDFIVSSAANIASQPLQNYDSNVWGVLTAISSNARKRRQGINILLTSDEHCLGRLPCHASYQIESNAISGNHCKVYRKQVTGGDGDNTSSCDVSVFVVDTSTNGTFLNWERLKKNGPEVRVQHGDIISLAVPPEHEKAFAFVYREVLGNNPALSVMNRKRKAEDTTCEIKRQKGIGIGGPNGPISLDDFKSLQRSNTELRKQLEAQVLTIDTLRNESRSIVEHHESEIKQIKESTAKSFHNELIELRDQLDTKQKELAQVNKLSAEQKNSIDELGERVSASLQSLSEANEVIKSQKASIAELKTGLDEERNQRREERETAVAELKAAMHRCQIEAQEELKRFSDAAMRHEREQQEVINKMKESEKERSMQVETLMSKLEDTRQRLVDSDNRNRQLEAQVSEEQLASANAQKKLEELDLEIKRLQKDLDSEKAAREEAWAKVSALELEISAAVRDLDVERQRHRGARERIMLRETQMRAFYSTTEEISALFAKQQEQLKTMQRTLEDEDNCDNTSLDIDLNPINRNPNRANVQEDKRATYHLNCAARASSSTSGQRSTRNEVLDTSCEDADATQKHDCEIMSQEGQNTQEAEYPSSEKVAKGGFGSDIEGVGTAPTSGTDPVGTEQVNETQSPGNDYERNDHLRKSIILAGDTMQIDCETQVHESVQNDGAVLLLRNPNDQRDTQDTEGVGTIRTSDLLASEVAGSWANSTAPSVHGENETERSREDEESQTQKIKEVTIVQDSAGQIGESQTKPTSPGVLVTKKDDAEPERGVINKPVGIIDQGKIKHGTGSDSETESCSESDDDHEKEKHNPVSDSDTEGSDMNDDKGSLSLDPDTEESHEADGDQKQVDNMDEDDKAT
ncbi:Forkhead-associated (FHA) domain [Arabidopsis thaliana x Arabidopsis arenosa]|uniref:Forkhead-associated (FHA) domain n=1 Tax=Arabidopsis thaliana x Arabidopsis arenosa TaxID=1240361 RepID=A0A8T2ADX0_9BRAS|nr:Forkhead-associated (FHA) domain [Arabidopsis thaliana x Arabidopsis arenosa]